jgi:hypothetical protein
MWIAFGEQIPSDSEIINAYARDLPADDMVSRPAAGKPFAPRVTSAVSFRSRLVRIPMAVWVIRIRGGHLPGSSRSLLRSADVLG